MRQRVGMALGIALLCIATQSWAGTLGIPLDSFLARLQTFVIGSGLTVGLVGLLGYIGSLFDNPFSTILSGGVNFFVKAGLLGGGTLICGALGLVAGSVLP